MEENSKKSFIWKFSKASASSIGAGIAVANAISFFSERRFGQWFGQWSDYWVEILSVVGGVIGVIIGYYFYRLSESRKD